MTLRTLTLAQQEAFFKDAADRALDAAEAHHVHPGLLPVLMIEAWLSETYLASPHLTRSFVMSCLDELGAEADTDEEITTMRARNIAGEALAMALADQIDNLKLTTTLTQARLQ